MIVKMSKIALAGLEKEKKRLLDSLMSMGVVEISEAESKLNDENWSGLVNRDGCLDRQNELETDIRKIESAIKYFSPYDQRKKGFLEPKREIVTSEINKVLEKKPNIMNTVSRIDEIESELSSLRSQESKLNNLIQLLIPWQSFNLPVNQCSTGKTTIILGTLPENTEIDVIKDELEKNAPFSIFHIVSKTSEQIYCAVLYHNSIEKSVVEILQKYGFSRTAFDGLEGTVSQNIERLKKETEEIQNSREVLANEVKELSSILFDLEILHDWFMMELDREKSYNNLMKTDNSFIFEGWLPSELAGKVKEKIENEFTCLVEISEPEDGEEFPVLLRNNSLIRPFEPLLELYSLPGSHGVDATGLLAPFFLISFAVMMGDAAYGLLMLLISGFFIWRYKLEGTMEKSIKLLFLCGAATVIIGALFGGWFGDLFDQIFGRPGVIPPLWFNSLEDPLRMLLWCVIFGAVQILFSMGIKGYMLIRDGKILDAIFDVLTWYIFLGGLALLAVPSLSVAGKYMAIGGVISIVLTQGRSQKGIFRKLLSGVLKLYDTVGILSDILSYSRLLAMGMAGAVIASVINTMGTILGVDNIFGIILLIIVALIGHTFNILSGGLGAFVHAARLQYVEFFGRFYEDGGKAFDPLKINTKYIKLKQEVK
ncbi:MAG TPA: V-type ATP synthase subunit I [Clostridiaceae bacterium]|jgi:V/A-type H+-transporting ATPase subunit I|nr:V-type ATP synthase subunit I [Clostridiaceae bacterium]